MIKLYGILNCDTVKKAKDWLKNNKIDVEFHDYRKEGVTKAKLQEWSDFFGWENVLNKRGTTWREAGAEKQAKASNRKGAIEFLLVNTSAIKRPVLEANGTYIIGFNEKEYEGVLLQNDPEIKHAGR